MTTNAPGSVVASYAYDYAVKFYDYASGKYPELKQTEADYRVTWHQAAIIVATMVQMERVVPGSSKELIDKTTKALSPQAKQRITGYIHDLTAVLRSSGATGYGDLAAADEKKLAVETGNWIARSILKKKEFSPSEALMAAGIGRSAWTSALMISRILQKKNKS